MQSALLDSFSVKQNAKREIQAHLSVKALIVVGTFLARIPRHADLSQEGVIRKVLFQNTEPMPKVPCGHWIHVVRLKEKLRR
jgi:hypothetical protein